MEDYNFFGFNWRVGRSWGLAHPDDICYNDPCSIADINGRVYLGVDYKPTDIPLPGYINPYEPDMGNLKHYDWSVGYISTLDTIKYGYLRVDFHLPIGNHLWPAIWLTDGKTWPPEIDIMEAWSGYYKWPIFKPRNMDKIYKNTPFTNRIFPTIHTGTTADERDCKSYDSLCNTWVSIIKPTKINTCELIWTPDRILIYYNGHKVVDETDPRILKYFNNSEGMEIHLNNYVTNDFTKADYEKMMRSNKNSKWFEIINLQYSPDYKPYLSGIK